MGARNLRLPAITTIDYNGINLIIMDSPSKSTVLHFVQECKSQHVSDIVRVCEDKYPTEKFEEAGIEVHHWEFSDGSAPPDNVLKEWLNLLQLRFFDNKATGPVAVHCIAGLGRAPVLVAVALMELGMPCTDAIEFIRSKREGSFNDRQLAYLISYRPKGRLRRPHRHCRIV